MLVLSRKVHEQIKIGNDVVITIVRVKGGTVRIGIEAPEEVPIRRGELAAHETSVLAGGEASARGSLAAGQLVPDFCG